MQVTSAIPTSASCEKAEKEPFIPSGREKHNQSIVERFAHQKPLPADTDTISKMRYKLKTDEGRRPYAKGKVLWNQYSASSNMSWDQTIPSS